MKRVRLRIDAVVVVPDRVDMMRVGNSKLVLSDGIRQFLREGEYFHVEPHSMTSIDMDPQTRAVGRDACRHPEHEQFASLAHCSGENCVGCPGCGYCEAAWSRDPLS